MSMPNISFNVVQRRLSFTVTNPQAVQFAVQSVSRPAISFAVNKVITLAVPGSSGSTSGLVTQQTAAVALSGGRLVRMGTQGVVYYDTTDMSGAYGLLGLTLNAAAQGATVSVQTGGVIHHAGLGLTPGHVYRAGLNGFLVETIQPGSVFAQIIGQAIDADTLSFSPQSPIIL